MITHTTLFLETIFLQFFFYCRHKKFNLMDSANFPIAETEFGPVKGIKKTSVLNTEYLSFQGVPYIKPPLGKLRFREAQMPQNWIDPFDATKEGPSYCMTDFMNGIQDGQENAGTINVYTKSLKPKILYPVMVWVNMK